MRSTLDRALKARLVLSDAVVMVNEVHQPISKGRRLERQIGVLIIGFTFREPVAMDSRSPSWYNTLCQPTAMAR
jgi:hypothetical protein